MKTSLRRIASSILPHQGFEDIRGVVGTQTHGRIACRLDIGKRDIVEQEQVLVEHLAREQHDSLGARGAYRREKVMSRNQAGDVHISAEERVFDGKHLEIPG